MNPPTLRHAGHLIAETLVEHGVDRAFGVPGESFLALLDGLYDSTVDVVVCRHEGGAAYMAEATGRMTGVPGVAMVTRGPGAANAFVALHSAWQDGVPLVLFVGLIPVADRGRESFQEFDPAAWFGTQTKRVLVLESPDRAGEIVAEAFHVATSGRPGPVVIGLPEDVVAAATTVAASRKRSVATGSISAEQLALLSESLRSAERPLFYIGAQGWTPEASAELAAFAERNEIPVLQEWRASDRIPFQSPSNAGWLGYGATERTSALLDGADVLVCIGAVLGDVATAGYTLRQDTAKVTHVITLDLELLGSSGPVDLQIAASPAAAASALTHLDLGRSADWRERTRGQHTGYIEESTIPANTADARPTRVGTAHMGQVVAAVYDRLPDDALMTFGAANHTSWAQRYFPTNTFPSLLSVRNGSMGYSVPSALAASLVAPDRTVVTIAGDGEFLMNGQELATAVQEHAVFLVIVMDNGHYGTIVSHQKRVYPNRPSGTALANPDFAELAKAFGAVGVRIDSDETIDAAVEKAFAALDAGVPALLHVVVDPDIDLA